MQPCLADEHLRTTQDHAPVGVIHLHSIVLDDDTVERAAKALFDLVFSCANRLDGKHVWEN